MKAINISDGVCDECGCPLPTNASECPVCHSPTIPLVRPQRRKQIQK